MEVLLANPRGFCAGVDRAITIVEEVLQIFNSPVYVRHEVVHNQYVVSDLEKKGAIFVDEVNEIPVRAVAVFSAHGVAQSVQQEAKERHLKVFDATCPLVTKVHIEVARNSQQGIETILIGHKGHPEVDGTMGQYDDDSTGSIYLIESVDDAHAIQVQNPDKLSYVTQTTLSVDDTKNIVTVLKQRFPNIQEPRKDDICYATQNRQNSVKRLVKQCDLILIIGSQSSSNSNRLYEIPLKHGIPVHMIDSASEMDIQWVKNKKCIGLSAGASAPELLVSEVVQQLKAWGASKVTEMDSIPEAVSFRLPRELESLVSSKQVVTK